MRQWELIGITDTVPVPQAPPPPRSRFVNAESIGAAAEGRPVFFWSTDTALRVRTVTGAATEAIGLPRSRVEGRDLINFGSSGIAGGHSFSIATGIRYKFNENIQAGIAAEFPLVRKYDLLDFRLTVDLIFRY